MRPYYRMRILERAMESGATKKPQRKIQSLIWFFSFFRRIFLSKKLLSTFNGFVMCCFGLLLMPSAIDSRPFKEVFCKLEAIEY